MADRLRSVALLIFAAVVAVMLFYAVMSMAVGPEDSGGSETASAPALPAEIETAPDALSDPDPDPEPDSPTPKPRSISRRVRPPATIPDPVKPAATPTGGQPGHAVITAPNLISVGEDLTGDATDPANEYVDLEFVIDGVVVHEDLDGIHGFNDFLLHIKSAWVGKILTITATTDDDRVTTRTVRIRP